MYIRIYFFALVIILSNIMVMSRKHLTGEHLRKACALSAELRSKGYPCQKVRRNLYLFLGEQLLGELLKPQLTNRGFFKKELKRLREIVKMVDFMSAPVFVCPQASADKPSGLHGMVLVIPKLKFQASLELQMPVLTMSGSNCKPGKSLRALGITKGIDTAMENLNQYLAENMCDLIPTSFVLDTEHPQKWKTFIEDYANNSTMVVSRKLEKLTGDGVLGECLVDGSFVIRDEDEDQKKGKKVEKDQKDKKDKKNKKDEQHSILSLINS